VRTTLNIGGTAWVGVELDEPKGKNDGHFAQSGERHFCCEPDHGLYLKADAECLIPVSSFWR